MKMIRILPALCATLTLAGAAERRIQKSDLPPAVLKEAERLSQGATIVGFTEEIEKGKRLYEVETKADGRGRDFLLDAAGNIVSIEQEIPFATLPAPVKKGLLAAAGNGRITKVESLSEGRKITYEAQVQGGPRQEVTVDAQGRPLR
jgi:uncharacterized membrane protein YkoI